jgi:hypothetical protein
MSSSSSATKNTARVLAPKHCRAICDEVGARLALVLRPATSDLPPRLAELLDRLALMDHDAPSIAPSIEDMVTLEETSPAQR